MKVIKFRKMKKSIKKYSFLFSFFLIFGACDDIEIVELNEGANTTVSLSESSIILKEDLEDDEVLTITWSKPDFGFDAAPIYKVLIDLEGGDFTNPQVIPVGTDLSKSFTAKELNINLLALGLIPDESGRVDVKIQTYLSEFQEMYSSPEVLVVTPYSTSLDLSTTWGIVGSAANDWGATPDLPFYKTNQEGILAAYVTLIDGEMKFRENNDWTVNYGDTGLDGTLEINGDNIPVTAGTYKIVMNLNDLTYTIENYSWGIVGSAYNDWGATPDANLTYDPYSDQWRTIVTLLDGDMKIRANNDWTINYGDTGADGFLDINGDNIVVSAGIYIVIVNFNDLSYSLEQIDNVWGLVGSAYNDWGATPDAQFTRDWSTKDEVWILNGVTLLDGEWKIRGNNEWTINYGDTGADGTLEINGDNMVSTAGIYNITLDFSNPDNPTYKIEPI